LYDFPSSNADTNPESERRDVGSGGACAFDGFVIITGAFGDCVGTTKADCARGGGCTTWMGVGGAIWRGVIGERGDGGFVVICSAGRGGGAGATVGRASGGGSEARETTSGALFARTTTGAVRREGGTTVGLPGNGLRETGACGENAFRPKARPAGVSLGREDIWNKRLLKFEGDHVLSEKRAYFSTEFEARIGRQMGSAKEDLFRNK
jgi:hypothetical protein